MSLAACFAKMNSGKPVFDQAEMGEITALANKMLAQNPKGGLDAAEKAAVDQMLTQAKADLNEVVGLVNEAVPATAAPAEEPVVKRKKKTVDVKASGMTAQAAPDVMPADEAAVADDPDLLLLNELRRLSTRDAKVGPIAADYLKRAANGENVREEAGAWVNAVTSDDRGVETLDARELASETEEQGGQDAKAMRDKLRKLFFNPAAFDKRVTVVQKESEVPSRFRGQGTSESNETSTRLGFYDPSTGHVWLIANNIPPGREFGVFMHEVGGHMGMLNLLGRANYNALVNQIKAWANGEGKPENDIAAAAWLRLEDAKAAGRKNRMLALSNDVMDDELIAYFIEEAAARGIDPTAMSSVPKGMQAWFLRLWNAVKRAVQKLGVDPRNLTAQEVVDIAYGAARLQLSASNTDIEAANDATGRPMTEPAFTDPNAQDKNIAKGRAMVERLKALYGGKDGYENYKNAAAEFFTNIPDFFKNAYDGIGTAGIVRLKERSDKILAELRAEYGDAQVNDNENWYELESTGTIGGIKGYYTYATASYTYDEETGFEGGTGVTVLLYPKELMDFLENTAEEFGLSSTDMVGEYPAALSIRLDIDQSLVIEAAPYGSKTYNWMAYRGLAETAKNAEGKTARFSDGQPWTRLKGDITPAQLTNLLAESHARVRHFLPSLEHLGVVWERATGATGFAGADKGGGRLGAVYFSERHNNSQVMNSIAVARRETRQMVENLPEPVRDGARWMNDSFRDLAKRGLHISMFTQDLVDSVESVLKTARPWFEAVNKRETLRITHEAAVDDIASNYIDQLSQSQFNRTWKLIHDMTKQAKWAYAPTWRNKVDVDPEMARRYAELDQVEKDALDAVFKHGNDTLTEVNKSLDRIANQLFDEKINKLTSPVAKEKMMRDKAKMLRMFGRKLSFPQGPYAPMRRVGSHVTVGKSQAYLDMEAKVQDGAENLRDQLDEMKTDERHYLVAFSDSRAEAEALKREYQGMGLNATASAKEVFTQNDQLPFQAFQSLREMATQREDRGVGKLINMIDELYLTALAETSARKSELRREGVSGLTPDTMYKAFLSKGKADAHYRAVLDTHEDVADKFSDMRREAHKSVSTRGDKMDAYNELKKRYEASFDYEPSPVISKLMNVSTYWMLLTKPAYYLYNLTQPFMMTVPYISKRFDYTDAANEMVKAYGDLFGMQKGKRLTDHFDLNSLPEDIRSAMTQLRDMGRLDITITQDLGNRIHSNRGNVSRYVSRMDAFFRTAAQKTEMANRVVTAAAAYRLSMAKDGDRTKAIEYAAEVIDKTQGNYSNFNAPRLFNMNNFARLMTQFRKFQLIQATLLINMVRQSFSGHERAANMRALSFMLGHHALLAGAIGMPAFNLIAMAFAMSGDDEEPRDLELWMKKNLGDDNIGQVLRYGVPALFNVNMANNVGMGQTFSAVPYAKVDATRSGYDSLITALMGPTVGGLGPQFWAAGGKGLDGDYYGMLAGLMPGFVKSTMTSVREAQDGVTNKAGDTLVSAEEIVFVDTLMKSAGLKTMKDTTRHLVTQKRYEFEAFFNDRTRDLRREYNKAYTDGDGLKMADLRERWVEMQFFKREYGFKAQPLSDLMKSPREQMERQRNTVSGVQFTERNRGFVQENIDADVYADDAVE